MNPLLFLYLNFIRGPQLDAQRRKKEEEERLAKEAAEPALAAAATVPKKKLEAATAELTSCKKCEGRVSVNEVDENFGLCNVCASNPMALLTPFVIFQLGGIVVALVVLVYRYLHNLPLV
ncbi:hypothetical protein H310_11866 [Aphanomyces invadans]|uniref:Uncharacterized protein n=1 Tax=Aphanomyces invadans TaxID=157072 RepID=A0A024TKB8_9STRA|nr:hypothetical protein H310_11866 [Aphanomyces invadans]ETV94605.1 hypothetical protein H310_11866 [Aphanomyces invadans]RHY29740.1 hypothetical protein DYB32_004892 [Aphanomyces invadans]|eukprot:XP_008876920.1 hypothetical protein H310_11866 [Aphanomyces invadans]